MTVGELTRISFDEGLELFQNASLEDLKAKANEIRQIKNPGNFVTYVIDTNPNYTNVCTADCLFCAFYRKPGKEGGYTLTVEEVMTKIAQSQKLGVTTVLLQGGLHPDLKMDFYVSLIKETKKDFQVLHPIFSVPPKFIIWQK
jgi:cyclic dehypoxanthinyl futalosine synthase